MSRWNKVRWGDAHWNPKKDYSAFPRRLPPTADEIADRAARKAHSWRYVAWWWTAVGATILVCITEPMHTRLQGHLEFLLGVTVGTWAELAMCERWPWRMLAWLRDRWKHRPTHEEFPGGDSCGDDAIRW